jgi:hypothetical protein
MMRRDGLKTVICKYPVRSFVAPLLWPIYWGTFPYNLIREWKIEAQVRRVGPLLRTLTQKEVREVRRVAALNKAEYCLWQKRYSSSHQFKHSLAIALAATILLSLFAASMASPISSSDQTGKYGTIISARGDPVLDRGGGSGEFSFEGTIPTAGEPESLVFFRIIPPTIEATREMQDEIEHVPYFGWLIASFITAIQSAGEILRHNGGNQNAEHNDRYLCGNRAAFVMCLVGE